MIKVYKFIGATKAEKKTAYMYSHNITRQQIHDTTETLTNIYTSNTHNYANIHTQNAQKSTCTDMNEYTYKQNTYEHKPA